jgi:hypothetical protein
MSKYVQGGTATFLFEIPKEISVTRARKKLMFEETSKVTEGFHLGR